jgi:hypothetical protein
MRVKDIMRYLANGGQVFRESGKDKFFYKLQKYSGIRSSELFCRCNELGGWHKSAPFLPGQMDQYEWHVATHDYSYNSWTGKLTMIPLPEYLTEVQTTVDNACFSLEL